MKRLGLSHADKLALIVSAAFFMEGLDASIIAPAIPEIAANFKTSAATVSAGISAYLLAVAVFIPVSGWAADRFGVRAVFCSAIAVFTIASVFCGLSQSLGEFILARVVQGIGGAMMSPVGRMEVLRETPKHQFMRAMAMVSWPGLTSFVVGPPLGGFLTTYVSWRWIFFINVPIGILGILLVWSVFTGKRAAPRPFDWRGFFLNGGALGVLMYGLDSLGHNAGAWQLGLAIIALGLVLGYVAVRHALRHTHPLIALDPLRHYTFVTGYLTAGLIFRLSIGALGFLLPTMYQLALGLSAFDAGLLIFAFALGDLSMKLRATYMVRLLGLRRLLVGNAFLIVAATLAPAAFSPSTPLWVMFVVMFVGGMFRSQNFTALSAMGFADIPTDRMGNATALSNMLQQIGIGFGVALAAVTLVTVHHWTGAPQGFSLTDFRIVLILLSILLLACVPPFVKLHPLAGANVSGHAPANREEGPPLEREKL